MWTHTQREGEGESQIKTCNQKSFLSIKAHIRKHNCTHTLCTHTLAHFLRFLHIETNLIRSHISLSHTQATTCKWTQQSGWLSHRIHSDHRSCSLPWRLISRLAQLPKQFVSVLQEWEKMCNVFRVWCEFMHLEVKAIVGYLGGNISLLVVRG